MDTANSLFFIMAVVFVAVVGLFGVGLMFVRGENIERNYLVGGLTLMTAVISGAMLAGLAPASQTTASLISISLVSILGYVVGRVIDAILGPRDHHVDEATLGADLSD